VDQRPLATLAEVKRALARFTFAPGWDIRVQVSPFYGEFELVIEFFAPNSRDGGVREANVRFNSTIPNYVMQDEEYFGVWFKNALKSLWIHEFDEWLRFDGELVHDPHAQDQVKRN
jgi:hypothetical protein